MLAPVANRVWKLVLAAGVACGGSGCSLAFVNGPPPNAEKLPFFDCTTSNVLPTVDLLFAGVAAIDAVGGTAGASALSESRADLIGFAVEGAIFAASAIYGYGKTSECKKAQAELFKRTPLTPTFSPGFAPPPPVPYDPWVVPPPPPSGPPPALSPVGPLPPVSAPPRPPARDDETPTGEKPVQ